MQKKIAFIDHSLDNFHSATFLKLFRGPIADRGWKVRNCWCVLEEEGRKWADENDLPFAGRFEDLAGCDGLMLLAPQNPETHLELARRALGLGVPLYIDKPFADTLDSAREIFRLADANNVPVFSTSALRFSPSLHAAIEERGGRAAIEHIRAWGGSGSFAEYAIHSVEMLVSTLGADAHRMMYLPLGRQTMILVEYPDGRSGTVFFHPQSDTVYQVMLSSEKLTAHIPCSGPMFEVLANKILDFFETGRPPVPRGETLLIRQILDLAASGKNPGHFLPLCGS